MQAFENLAHFAALDWAKEHHDICIVDGTGNIVAEFRIEETAEGWHTFRERIRTYPSLAIALETSSGPVVERLLDAGCTVYPVQPRAARQYRLRQAPSGTLETALMTTPEQTSDSNQQIETGLLAHWHGAHLLALRITNDAQAAEDAVQEAFLKAVDEARRHPPQERTPRPPR